MVTHDPAADVPEKLRAISHTLSCMFQSNQRGDFAVLAKLVGSLIEQAQEIEAMACHRIGLASQHKEPLLCSLPLAKSPTSESLPSSSPP